MKRTPAWICLGLLATAMALSGQPGGQQAPPSGGKAPVASNPVVELKGKITKVQVATGEGMPYFELDGKTKVLLGSMRYLMENDFNPKAGSRAEVKGYRMADQVVAITVSLPEEKKTLKLRDEGGWPMWGGGRQARGRAGEGCCGMKKK